MSIAGSTLTQRQRRVLRHPDLRWLLTGVTVSALGNAITPIALAFAVLDLGGGVVELGLVEAVFAACQVLTSLVGGVLGDRVSRTVMMEGSSIASALVMALLASSVIAGVATIPTLAVLGGLAGVVAALSQPSSKALTRQVVPQAELADAVALRALLNTGAYTVGFALGGVLVAAVGSGWAIGIDALTFLLAAFAYTRLRIPHVRATTRETFLADLGAGVREVTRHDWLWLLILQALLYHVFYSGAQGVLGPIVVGDGFGRQAWGFALAALMAGFAVGGLLCLRIRPRYPLRIGVVLLAATGLFPLAMAASDALWPILVGAFLHGVGLQVFDVHWEQAIQTHIADDKLARVYSIDLVGSFIARPVGLALTGPVAAAVGYDGWLIVIAVVISGSSLLALLAPGVRRLQRVG